MIKSAVKSFFIALKHYFTPLGVMFAAVIIGGAIAISGSVSAVKTAVNETKTVFDEYSLSVAQFVDDVKTEAESFDLTNPVTSAETIYSAIESKTYELFDESENDAAKVVDSVTRAVEKIAGYVAVFICFFVLSIPVAFIITNKIVRNAVAKRKFRYFLLSVALNAVTSTAIILVIAWSVNKSVLIGFAVTAGCLLFKSFELLNYAYLSQRRCGVKYKTVVNLKNAIGLYLSYFAIAGLCVAASAVVYAVFGNAVVCSLLTIPVAIIAVSVSSMNAEAYVKNLGLKASA